VVQDDRHNEVQRFVSDISHKLGAHDHIGSSVCDRAHKLVVCHSYGILVHAMTSGTESMKSPRL
jgi:hypothetical protein